MKKKQRMEMQSQKQSSEEPTRGNVLTKLIAFAIDEVANSIVSGIKT